MNIKYPKFHTLNFIPTQIFHMNDNLISPAQIQNAHGESEITAMVIDLPSKLLTGSSDGTIKIWDINTTACHRVLQAGMEGPVDILQV